jgi:hypothetical protein
MAPESAQQISLAHASCKKSCDANGYSDHVAGLTAAKACIDVCSEFQNIYTCMCVCMYVCMYTCGIFCADKACINVPWYSDHVAGPTAANACIDVCSEFQNVYMYTCGIFFDAKGMYACALLV